MNGNRATVAPGHGQPFSRRRLIIASLAHHWRIHLATAASVAVMTAVLTGALLVGDSMRGSLRALAVDRLGRIDAMLMTDRFFRAELAGELAKSDTFPSDFTDAQPAVLLPVTIERPSQTNQASRDRINQASRGREPSSTGAAAPPRPTPTGQLADAPARAVADDIARAVADDIARAVADVNLLGIDATFWQLGPPDAMVVPDTTPRPRQVVLNRPAAERLGARVGDELLLRLPSVGGIPEETPLGRRDRSILTARVELVAIVPDRGLGRFGMRPSQHQPMNAYVERGWLAEQLDRPGRANAMLIAGSNVDGPPAPEVERQLQLALEPRLTDYSLTCERTPRGYVNVTSRRMLISPRMERAILESLGQRAASHAAGRPPSSVQPPFAVQPALTYLANTIAVGPATIPYSTVTAIDFTDTSPLGPFRSVDGKPLPPLEDGQIVLNRWAADALSVKPGERVRLDFFEPTTLEGNPTERSVTLELVGIAAMEGAAVDRHLTPSVPGVTDELTMADWDPPFPFDAKRITDADEAYWDQYGPTPKAFVSLATGRRLWASRFGRTTSLRLAGDSGQSTLDVEDVGDVITPAPADVGFRFQPVKRRALDAAVGTTPFSVLFLGFSMFLIGSAVLLTALLFRLGVDTRAAEVGLLTTVGLRRRRVVGLLVAEGGLIALIGSIVGTVLGIGYAALMLVGLRTWWLAAIVTPFLRLHVSAGSITIGLGTGLVVAVATIAWSVRRAVRVPPRRLLAGQTEPAIAGRPGRWLGGRFAGWGLMAGAVVAGGLAMRVGEELRAGVFFGAGAMVLLGAVILARAAMIRGGTGTLIGSRRGALIRLAARGAARHPSRSTLSIALVGSACFLIVAVSAFHIDPASGPPRLNSGDGGFALYAESTQPLFHDLGTNAGRRALGFSAEQRARLDRISIISLRAKPGDDASCLNLYQAARPRLVGVSDALIDHGGFAWADRGDGGDNPVGSPGTELEFAL